MKIKEIKGLSTQYSKIILEDNSEHIITNNGPFPLKWWIDYFEKEYK